MRRSILGIILSLFPILGLCDTLHVPGVYADIQAAIDASIHGDVVLVEPGTYLENIDFKGKLITVTSAEGPEGTVIDGSQAGSVVTFASKESTGVLLQGFTITNGSGTYHSSGGYHGGGIYCMGSKPTIEGNIITLNSLSGSLSSGGGIHCNSYAEPLIKNNVVSCNTVTGDASHPGRGGGIYYDNFSNPLITCNRIQQNTVDGYGGGIYLIISYGQVISGNVISENAAEEGGGIWTRGNLLSSITSCSNTITNNYADSGVAGGWYMGGQSSWNLVNTIIWGNNGIYFPEISFFNADSGSSLNIDFSDVKGGEESIHVGYGCNLKWSLTNIDEDPLFVGPFDYHIRYDSPCRHSGSNGAPHLPLTDFEGDPRKAHLRTDMGADEFYTHLYVTGDVVPGGSVKGNLVGLPGTSPVGLFFGTGVLLSPVNTMWGAFHLQGPLLLFPLVPIPGTGVLELPATLPVTPPAPYDIPMQALIGLNADSLSNLHVMNVR
jgi:hypothetical protein